VTPEKLRQVAADLEAKAEEAFRAGKAAEGEAFLDAAWAARDKADQRERQLAEQANGLPDTSPPRNIRNMSVDTRGFAADVKRGVGRATRKHPAQMKLYAKGVTISALAKELRETRARVNSWMNAGKDVRPIPRHHAEYLRERYGIPLSAWDRIQG
jgi:hypothetical protein